MQKIMKISGFPKAVTAFAALVALIAGSSYANSRLQEILKTPGIAEQLQASNVGKSTSDTEQDTPLVRQARDFALRINPPPPPKPVEPVPSFEDRRPIRPQAEVSAKFKLIGTSYHFADNAQSWALVDEVGKGIHWVKQGSKIGHLAVEKVGDGGVLINDNGRKYELLAERQEKPDVVKSYSGILDEKPPITLLTEQDKIASQPQTPDSESQSPPVEEPQPVAVPELTPEEQLKQTQDSIEWLKQLQQEPNSAGMSEDEANGLSGLGEMLKALEMEAENLQQAPTESNVPPPQPPAEQSTQEEVNNDTQTPPETTQSPPPDTSRDARIRRLRERR